MKRYILRSMALASVLALAVLLCVPVSAAWEEELSTERQIYGYLTEELQLNSAAACGILANVEQESNFQLNVVGDLGTSYGLFQWHNERYVLLRSYCAGLGLDYRTVEGQLEYLSYELNSKYTEVYLSLKGVENNADGAYAAAYLWCTQFERPADMEEKAVDRGNLARLKYWNRYNAFQMIRQDTAVPDVEEVIVALQEPVTIPLPPAQEESASKHDYEPQPPEKIVYTPLHRPVMELEEPSGNRTVLVVLLIGLIAAMVAVVVLPAPKKRRGKFQQPRRRAAA